MNPEYAKHVIKAIKDLTKRDDHFSLNELRIIVALERATARLSGNKDLVDHLIFKGGFVLLKIYESRRFTRDADALAVSISKKKLSDLVGKALAVDLNDGLWFGDLQIEEIDEQGEYGAYRFNCAFHIGEPDLKKIKNLSRIHIDVGFSDQLPQIPIQQSMPSILGTKDPVTWRVYPQEFIAAEKIQTIFDRGSANSRAKDVYDLNYLLPRCLDSKVLRSALVQTFENRGTKLPDSLQKEAQQIDTSILALSWPGIEINTKRDFKQAWEELVGHFKLIDEH